MIDTKELRRVAVDCSWPTSPVPIDDIINRLEAAEKERDALRAKIEAMERQEIGFRERCTPSSPTGYSNRFPLYALPVAKGE